MWEVLTGLVPFDGIPNEALSAMVLYEKRKPEPSPEGEEEELVTLMQKLTYLSHKMISLQ